MIYIIITIFALIRWYKHDRITYYFILQFLILKGYNLSFFNDNPFRPDDLALGLICITFFSQLIKNRFRTNDFNKLIILFLLFLLVSICVSIFIYEIPLQQVIKGVRTYLYILCIYDIMKLKKVEIEKTLKYIFYFNLFIGICFVIQTFIPINILRSETLTEVQRTGFLGLQRSFSFPKLISFCCFYSFFLLNKNKNRLLLISICYIILFIIQSRGLIINTTLLIALGLFFLNSNDNKKTIYYLVIFCIFIIINNSILTGETGDKTTNDIEMILSGEFKDFDFFNTPNNNATLSYRFYLVYRVIIHLLTNDIIKLIFGTGLFVELPYEKIKDLDLQNISFESWDGYGIFTPDISYSNILCNLGLVGFIIYVLFFIKLLKYFYLNKKNNYKYGILGFLYMLFLFITGFNSSYISTPICLLIPFILYRYLYLEKKQYTKK